MYVNFRSDGWPLCPYCKQDELYSALVLKTTDPVAAKKLTVQQCTRDVMRCYACGWASDNKERKTYLGCRVIVRDVWPPQMVFPNDPRNVTGATEIHTRAFRFAYSAALDTWCAPIPMGPEVADADLFA